MQLLTELLDINVHNTFFITENNIGSLKDLGLGRMINAFKQSFSLAGRGSTARLNQTNVGGKIQARSTGIGPGSEVLDQGHVRNWPHVRREVIKNLVDPGVSAIMFRIDEKPVALIVLGPQWSINNSKAVVGMAWDFTNVSGSDQEVKSVLNGLSIKRKAAADKEAKDGKKTDVPLRMYQGYAQTMDQVTEFVKMGVNAFGNRFDFAFITPEPEKDAKKDEKDPKGKKTVKESISDTPPSAEDLKWSIANIKQVKKDIEAIAAKDKYNPENFTGKGQSKQKRDAEHWQSVFRALQTRQDLGIKLHEKFIPEFNAIQERIIKGLKDKDVDELKKCHQEIKQLVIEYDLVKILRRISQPGVVRLKVERGYPQKLVNLINYVLAVRDQMPKDILAAGRTDAENARAAKASAAMRARWGSFT